MPDWLGSGGPPRRPLHRKLWECCAIAQALSERRMLTAGRRRLGFGVGREPLSSLFALHGVYVTATDLETSEPAAEAWRATQQHASRLDDLYVGHIVDREVFDRLV